VFALQPPGATGDHKHEQDDQQTAPGKGQPDAGTMKSFDISRQRLLVAMAEHHAAGILRLQTIDQLVIHADCLDRVGEMAMILMRWESRHSFGVF
jgi:hypothetical protein